MQIQKTHKQNNIKNKWKNSHLHNKTLDLCWPSSPGHGACVRVWMMFSDTRKLVFLCQQGSGTGNFLFRGATPCPLFPLSSGIFPELNPCRNCVCCHRLCDAHIYQFCCAERHCFLRANFFHFFLPLCVHTSVSAIYMHIYYIHD